MHSIEASQATLESRRFKVDESVSKARLSLSLRFDALVGRWQRVSRAQQTPRTCGNIDSIELREKLYGKLRCAR